MKGLKHEAKMATPECCGLIGVARLHHLTRHLDLACVGLIEPCDQIEKRRLAAA